MGVTFGLYYFVSLNFLVPSLARRIKVRQRKAARGAAAGDSSEVEVAGEAFDGRLREGLGAVQKDTLATLEGCDTYVSEGVAAADSGDLAEGNTAYLDGRVDQRVAGVVVAGLPASVEIDADAVTGDVARDGSVWAAGWGEAVGSHGSAVDASSAGSAVELEWEYAPGDIDPELAALGQEIDKLSDDIDEDSPEALELEAKLNRWE